MKMLCIDGGGAFGKIPAKVLWEADCFGKFDAFVGTSIGSTVAAVCAMDNTATFGPIFFDQWMPKVFKHDSLRNLNPFNSKYADDGLNAALQSVFGNAFVRDVKKPLFFTAANIGLCSLKVFSSVDNSDSSWLMWEAMRCSVAAETYFPSWKGYADGGVFANNPSMVGVAAAVKTLGAKLEDLEVLSIGTGTSSSNMSPPEHEALWWWGSWLLNALLEGASDKMHEYFARAMPLKKFERIQFVRQKGWQIDNIADVHIAERVWANDINKAIATVKAF